MTRKFLTQMVSMNKRVKIQIYVIISCLKAYCGSTGDCWVSRICDHNLTEDPPCISGSTSGVRRAVSVGVIVYQPHCQRRAVDDSAGDHEGNLW